MTAAGRNKKPLSTGTDGIWMQPMVGGDGRTIVFVSNRSGTTQMWRMGIDGENASQLTTSNSPVFNGTMLSDGKTVIFQKYEKPGGWHIYKQVGSEPAVPISDLQISTWDLAPDERSLAIWAEDPNTKKWKLVIMSLDNGAILKTVDIKANETMVRWTRDGNSLTYIETKDDLTEMKLQSVNDASPAKTIATFRGEPVLWFQWSPDGKRLAIIRGKRVADAVMITRNQPN
jgi:Tol biopolymer transport system component